MQNITSATTTTLIEKGTGHGSVGSMRIVNNHSGDSQVSVWITDDTTDLYLIKNLVMPTATAFVLDGIYFDIDFQSLKIQTHSATTDVMVQLSYEK
jgi:hypothetical protein